MLLLLLCHLKLENICTLCLLSLLSPFGCWLKVFGFRLKLLCHFEATDNLLDNTTGERIWSRSFCIYSANPLKYSKKHPPTRHNIGIHGNYNLFKTYFVQRVEYIERSISNAAILSCLPNQNSQVVQKKERFLIWTRQNNVRIFGKCCLRQRDERTNRCKTRTVVNT